MELQVELPTHPTDFHHLPTSNCSSPASSPSPYLTAPSSPRHPFDFFFYSAPSSPSRRLDHLPLLSSSAVPFTWESLPGVPKATTTIDDDFEFDFSGHLEPPVLSAADELFDGGKILPLKPPPRLQVHQPPPPSDSPKSPISKLRGAFSPKHRQKDFDPFEVALERTRRSDFSHRGRAKDPDPRPRPRKGISRSLSPLRVSEFALKQQQLEQSNNSSTNGSSSSFSSSSRGFRKWRLKDFLLFRSASEGRANTKLDPVKKHSVSSALFSSITNNDSKKIHGDDEKNSSFRSISGAGEGSTSSRRRSAHELHYAANKAASEEMKKKTSLPYKYGLLGCLGLNPSSSGLQELPRGFGYSVSR